MNSRPDRLGHDSGRNANTTPNTINHMPTHSNIDTPVSPLAGGLENDAVCIGSSELARRKAMFQQNNNSNNKTTPSKQSIRSQGDSPKVLARPAAIKAPNRAKSEGASNHNNGNCSNSHNNEDTRRNFFQSKLRSKSMSLNNRSHEFLPLPRRTSINAGTDKNNKMNPIVEIAEKENETKGPLEKAPKIAPGRRPAPPKRTKSSVTASEGGILRKPTITKKRVPEQQKQLDKPLGDVSHPEHSPLKPLSPRRAKSMGSTDARRGMVRPTSALGDISLSEHSPTQLSSPARRVKSIGSTDARRVLARTTSSSNKVVKKKASTSISSGDNVIKRPMVIKRNTSSASGNNEPLIQDTSSHCNDKKGPPRRVLSGKWKSRKDYVDLHFTNNGSTNHPDEISESHDGSESTMNNSCSTNRTGRSFFSALSGIARSVTRSVSRSVSVRRRRQRSNRSGSTNRTPSSRSRSTRSRSQSTRRAYSEDGGITDGEGSCRSNYFRSTGSKRNPRNWQDKVFKATSDNSASASDSNHGHSHASLNDSLMVRIEPDPRAMLRNNNSFSSSTYNSSQGGGMLEQEDEFNGLREPSLLDTAPCVPRRQCSDPNTPVSRTNGSRAWCPPESDANNNDDGERPVSLSAHSTASELSMGDPVIIRIKRSSRQAMEAAARQQQQKDQQEQNKKFVPPPFIIIGPKNNYSLNSNDEDSRRIVEV